MVAPTFNQVALREASRVLAVRRQLTRELLVRVAPVELDPPCAVATATSRIGGIFYQQGSPRAVHSFGGVHHV